MSETMKATMNTDTYQNSESAAIDSAERATQPRTAMNFPGTNSLTLNEDAIMAALQSVLPMLVGARITSMSCIQSPEGAGGSGSVVKLMSSVRDV